MAISRMQNPQQLQGIGSLRQPYGLGGFLKKAFKKVKKVAKSPLGKAAIIGGLGMIPFGGASTWSRLGRMLKGASTASKGGGIWNAIRGGAGKYLNPFNTSNPLLYTKGALSGKKLFGLGATSMISMPFIQKALKWGPYADEGEEEAEDWGAMPSTIANLRNQAQDYYRTATPNMAASPFMVDRQFVNPNFYAADGGRAGLLNGGGAGEAQIEQMLRAEYLKYKNKGGTMPYEQFKILVMQQAQQGQTPNQMMAAGGRAGYLFGDRVEQQTDFIEGPGGTEEFDETLMASDPGAGDDMNQAMEFFSLKLYGKSVDQLTEDEYLNLQESLPDLMSQMTGGDTEFAAQGGRIGAQEGGLMDLGGQEKDYREEGGFVPLGEEERADDVPARLSKNEFVFTADAVRAAGGGDIDAGSEVMQNVMNNLEQGGEVSEDSQGLGGGEEIMSEELVEDINPAQGMYNNYEQLQSRVA